MTDWDAVSTTAPPPSTQEHTSWEAVSSETPEQTPAEGSPVSNEIGKGLQALGVAGPLEAAAHTVTGALSGLPAGVASAYKLATAPWGNKAKAAAEASSGIQNAMTYQPRTDEGKDIAAGTDRVLGALGPTEGQWLQDKALQYGANPYVAGGLNVAAQIPATLLGAKLGAGKTLGRTVAPEVQQAAANNIRITPQQAGAGIGARVSSSLAGRVQLERELSHKNAPQIDEMARNDVGLPQGTRLNTQTLDHAAAPHEAAYEQVGQLGTVRADPAYRQQVLDVPNHSGAGGSFAFDTPGIVARRIRNYANVREFDAGDAVARMKALRAEANRIDSSPMYSPDSSAVARANRALADALEDQLDRHVQQLTRPVTLPGGQTITPSLVPPDLLDRFRNGRVALAKINNIRHALVGPNVDAARILRQRNNGAQLTGGLAEIANMAENFDRSVQVPAKIRDHEVGMGDLFLGSAGLFGAGHSAVAGGMAASNPGIAAGLALATARPLTRRMMNSRLYQRYLTHPPRLPVSALTTPAVTGATQSSEPAVQGVFGQPYDAGTPMEPR